MIFSREVKADYEIPGLKWEPTDEGGLKGRLYSALPVRLHMRIKPALLISFIPVMLATGQYHSVYESGSFEFFIREWTKLFAIIYGFMVLWPFWPFSTSSAIDAQHFKINGKRYRLEDMGAFDTQRISYTPGKTDEIITFQYGRKTVKIKTPNTPANAFQAAEYLNWAHGRLLARGTLVADDPAGLDEARAAAF